MITHPAVKHRYGINARRLCLVDKKYADITINSTLQSSLGCTVMPPIDSQLRAPPTTLPSTSVLASKPNVSSMNIQLNLPKSFVLLMNFITISITREPPSTIINCRIAYAVFMR